MDGTHRKDAQTLLSALRDDLAGRQKAVALTVYDDATPATAESHMSRLVSGANCEAAWRTLALVLRDEPTHLLRAIGDLAHADWTPRIHDPGAVLVDVRSELRRIADQLASMQSVVDRLDAAELREQRRGPIKVRHRGTDGQRQA